MQHTMELTLNHDENSHLLSLILRLPSAVLSSDQQARVAQVQETLVVKEPEEPGASTTAVEAGTRVQGPTLVDTSGATVSDMATIWERLFSQPLQQSIKMHATVARLYEATQHVQVVQDQKVFDEQAQIIFEALKALESVDLAKSRFLFSNVHLSVADLALFTLLVRWDIVFYPLFRLNQRRLKEFPNLYGYARDVFLSPGVHDTVNMAHIKAHYWRSLGMALSGRHIVPKGGQSDLWLPHNRHVTFAAAAAEEAKSESKQGAAVATVDSSVHSAGVAGGDVKDAATAARLAKKGAFVRPVSKFRHIIVPAPISTQEQEQESQPRFVAEPNRYVLYLSHNCPWCHRVSLTVGMKGLQNVIQLIYVHYRRDPEKGWQFRPELTGDADVVNGTKYVPELYQLADPSSTEKSVPVLWDKKHKTIVSNESAEIVRMLNSAFDAYADPKSPNLYPSHLRYDIDQLNAWIYPQINNGAYKAGFASSQEKYDEAFDAFFAALDRLEYILSQPTPFRPITITAARGGQQAGPAGSHRPFLTGDQFTEADLRLFPTLFRFDHVYYTRFRLNKCMIRDAYPLLRAWITRVYALKGIADFSNLQHCILGYFGRTGSNIIPTAPHFAFGQ